MNALRLSAALLCCFALAVLVTAPAGAAEKATNKEKIVGTWEVTKAGSDLPEGSTIEFTKDGKLILSGKMGDQEFKMEGTYKLEGDKFDFTLKMGDQEHSDQITIKKLNDTTLSTANKEGKAVELTRKK